jgi:hypothetical protein
MTEVTNQTRRPQTLSDGTILAAAGTNGSTKTVNAISDADQKRLGGRGWISVSEKRRPLSAVQRSTPKAQSPEAAAPTSAAAAKNETSQPQES